MKRSKLSIERQRATMKKNKLERHRLASESQKRIALSTETKAKAMQHDDFALEGPLNDQARIASLEKIIENWKHMDEDLRTRLYRAKSVMAAMVEAL